MSLNSQQKNKNTRQDKSKPISGRSKLLLLAVFCLLSGSISFYTANRSFSGKPGLLFSLSSIKKPKYIQQNGQDMRAPAGIGQEEYRRIQDFKKYMDSIASTPSGRKIFDSIITARPGLIDSILISGYLFQSQTKTQNHGTTNQ